MHRVAIALTGAYMWIPACGRLTSGGQLIANGAGMPRWDSMKLPVANVG